MPPFPTRLVESELFGHAKGSFTGATATRIGRFTQADGGTIFLDEIGEMELGVQAKLLRLIQDGEFYPIGETNPVEVDVRILAATNRKLEAEVAANRFRADLFWRLNVIPIELPPLRQRRSDIPLLVEHFVRRANEHHRRQVSGRRQRGPGRPEPSWLAGQHPRAREPDRAARHHEGRRHPRPRRPAGHAPLTAPRRPPRPSHSAMPELPADGTDLRAILEAVEDRMIAEALQRTGGNKNRAAELLGLNRTTLVEKLRRKRSGTGAHS